MASNLKRRTYEILDVAKPGDRLSRAFDILLVSLIGLNIVALMAESVEPIYRVSPVFFWTIEAVSVAIFTAEYLARLWSCNWNEKYSGSLWGRLRFAVTPLALIDLLAILPFYLPFLGIDLRVIRSVRLVRVFRIAKLARYSDALRMMGRVFMKKREELIAIFLVAVVILLCASTVMYYIEHDAQPEKFASIPETMWWGAATLTTVGYGDVYPITPLGKFIGSIIAVLGIGLFALPTGLLGAAFVEELGKKRIPAQCPHCGEALSE